MRQELAIRDKINTILNEGEQLNESAILTGLAALVAFIGGIYAAMQGVKKLEDHATRRNWLVTEIEGMIEKAKELADRYPGFQRVFARIANRMALIMSDIRDEANADLYNLMKEFMAELVRLKKAAVEYQENLSHMGRS